MFRTVMVWLVIMLLLGQWGCAIHSHQIAPPSEQVRAQVGTVGVASLGVIPGSALEGPTSGKWSGAAKGAGLGARNMLLGGLVMAAGVSFASGGAGALVGGAILALAIGLTPVAALVGGIYGAVAAEPADKVKAAEAALKSAFTDLKVQEAIRDRILRVARDRTDYGLVPLGENVDVDTILEISLPSLGLVGPAAVDPELFLIVRACPRLVRAADGAELYPPGPEGLREVAYTSVPRKFFEWAAEDARLFREEMERSYQGLAEKIVEDIFLLSLPPGRRWTDVGPSSLRTAACPAASGEARR
jgi:hypothetical protein